MGVLRAAAGLTRSSLLAGLVSLVAASACDNRVSLGLLPPSPDGGMDAPVDRPLDASLDVPAELPIEGPTLFEFAVNMKTARQLAVVPPMSVLLRADQVID